MGLWVVSQALLLAFTGYHGQLDEGDHHLFLLRARQFGECLAALRLHEDIERFRGHRLTIDVGVGR